MIRLLAASLIGAIATSVNAGSVADPVADPSLWSDSIVTLTEVEVSAVKNFASPQAEAASTSLSRRSLDRYGVDDPKQMSLVAPNFYVPQYGSRMTSSIYVRGLGARIDQPVMGLLVDNVPILNKDAYDFSSPDISRITVSRGPQSTLFGRNTMGGLIDVATAQPTDGSRLRAQIGYGSANSFNASLESYLRLTRQLGIGLVGAYSRSDGFFRNIFTGNKVDCEQQGYAKVKLLWNPSARFTLQNSLWTNITRQGGFPYQSLATGEINHNDTCSYRRETLIDGLTASWLGDGVEVTSVTSLQYLHDAMTLDQDFSPKDWFTLVQRRHEWALTEDVVVRSSVADPYRWLAGVFAFYRRTDMSAPVTFGDSGLRDLIETPMQQATGGRMSLIWDERTLPLNSDFIMPSVGWALYHKSQLQLADRWALSASLRLAWERASIDYHSYAAATYTIYAPMAGMSVPVRHGSVDVDLADQLHQSWLQLLPDLKIDYTPADWLTISASWAKGYKAGGYNTQMFSDILRQQLMGSMSPSDPIDVDQVISYKPETSYNYQLSAVANPLDERLRAKVDLFWIDCRNQQMTIFPDGNSTGRMMANAGRTRSIGVEASMRFAPDAHWIFDAAYGMADARFRRYDDGTSDYRGNHVPYAPANTMFAAATYICPISATWIKSVEATASCRGVGRIFWNEANTAIQPFYATLGVNLTMRLPKADVMVWAENLTDTGYSTFYFMSVGNEFVQRGNPRRIGVTLRLNFQQ